MRRWFLWWSLFGGCLVGCSDRPEAPAPSAGGAPTGGTNLTADLRPPLPASATGASAVTVPAAAVTLPQSTAGRRARYQSLIDTIALGEGLDPDLAHAVITAESHYNPVAASSAKAVGLMQIIPGTAIRFGLQPGERTDPAKNVRAGVRYLKWLLRYFQGQVHLAVAAYNAGEGAVRKYGGIPPYRETQRYVPTVLGYYQLYRRQRQTGALLAQGGERRDWQRRETRTLQDTRDPSRE